jgi:hypothetical protein
MATNAINLYFGDQQDIEIFAKRIKTMMRGGEKLSINDAMSLAQVAAVTHLNPFIGEVWWIPGSGAMVGIAGARRLDQQETKERGGYSWPIVTSCSPEEAGATEFEVKDVVASFKTEINDSAATAEYQKMFSATLESMRSAGVADPFSAAKEVCGPRPVWTGYGLAKKSDQSRMSKVQLARKRSEADALKKKTVIPFGAQVAETDVSPDYVDAEATDLEPRRSREQNMSELGFDDAEKNHDIGLGNLDADFPPETPKDEPPAIEIVDPMGDWAVSFAAGKWNTDNSTAAKEIGKKKLGKRIDKKEFIQIVTGEPA